MLARALGLSIDLPLSKRVGFIVSFNFTNVYD